MVKKDLLLIISLAAMETKFILGKRHDPFTLLILKSIFIKTKLEPSKNKRNENIWLYWLCMTVIDKEPTSCLL